MKQVEPLRIVAGRAREHGAALAEYVIAISILAAAFMVAAYLIENAARARSATAIEAVSDMVPCGGEIRGEACY